MIRVWRLALAAWWRELIEYALLNVLFLGVSLTVIGGPPALAAMYQMAADSADWHYVSWRSYGAALKKLFGPAWRWGIIQLIIYGIGGFNFLYYSYAAGSFWALMRFGWFSLLTVWTVLNLFYWPFYLEQTDRRLVNTYRNVLVMCATRPGLVLGIVALTVLTFVFSAFTVILFAFAVMPLVALLSTFAVREVLSHHRHQSAAG